MHQRRQARKLGSARVAEHVDVRRIGAGRHRHQPTGEVVDHVRLVGPQLQQRVVAEQNHGLTVDHDARWRLDVALPDPIGREERKRRAALAHGLAARAARAPERSHGIDPAELRGHENDELLRKLRQPQRRFGRRQSHRHSGHTACGDGCGALHPGLSLISGAGRSSRAAGADASAA